MSEQDYQEIGKAMAGAILEGDKSRSWALELLRPLEFGAKDLDEWLVRYKRERYEAIRWQGQKRAHRRQKIAQLQEQASRLLEQNDLQEVDGSSMTP